MTDNNYYLYTKLQLLIEISCLMLPLLELCLAAIYDSMTYELGMFYFHTYYL